MIERVSAAAADGADGAPPDHVRAQRTDEEGDDSINFSGVATAIIIEPLRRERERGISHQQRPFEANNTYPNSFPLSMKEIRAPQTV